MMWKQRKWVNCQGIIFASCLCCSWRCKKQEQRQNSPRWKYLHWLEVSLPPEAIKIWTLCPRRKRRCKKCHLPYFNKSWAQSWRDQEFKCMLLNWSWNKIAAQESERSIRGGKRRIPLAYSNNILSFPYSNKKWAHYSFSVSDNIMRDAQCDAIANKQQVTECVEYE
jgi:hypothetical protein